MFRFFPTFGLGCCFSGIELYELIFLKINPLSVVSFAIIFSHAEGCLSTLFVVSFAVQKLLSLIRFHLFSFFFYFHYSRRWIIEVLALIYVIKCSAYIFLLRVLSFLVLHLGL